MDLKKEEPKVKQLKKLSRLELVEIIVQKCKEIDQLQLRLAEAEKKLEQRELVCKENGNIAEAALQINKIFEVCQKAADDYLNNIQKQNPQIHDQKLENEDNPVIEDEQQEDEAHAE